MTRRLELDEEGYGGRLVVAIENGSGAAIHPALELVFYGQERPADALDHFPKYSVVASVDGSVHRTPAAGDRIHRVLRLSDGQGTAHRDGLPGARRLGRDRQPVLPARRRAAEPAGGVGIPGTARDGARRFAAQARAGRAAARHEPGAQLPAVLRSEDRRGRERGRPEARHVDRRRLGLGAPARVRVRRDAALDARPRRPELRRRDHPAHDPGPRGDLSADAASDGVDEALQLDRAADEGDPGEVRERPREDAGRAGQDLQLDGHQPAHGDGRRLRPDADPDARHVRALLRAADLDRAAPRAVRALDSTISRRRRTSSPSAESRSGCCRS